MNSENSLAPSKPTSLPPLPPSDDYIFEGGDKEQVDVTKLIPLLCTPESHQYVLNATKREAICSKCKHGFKFKISEVVERDGKVFVKDSRNFEHELAV